MAGSETPAKLAKMDFLEQNLYGVRLFESSEFDDQAIEDYIIQQEKTHIAEGLALQQRSPRVLEFDGGHVRGFGGQTMAEVNEEGLKSAKRQYWNGDEAAYVLVKRRQHDVAISDRYDELMQHGETGQGFLVFSPYDEEHNPETAKRLGFWPEYRRSYAWFYRKKSETELECVDVSIDQSSVETYKKLLENLEVEFDQETKSYDIPQYFEEFKFSNDEEFQNFISGIITRYKELNEDPQAKSASDAFEAIDFIEKHAGQYLKLMAELQKNVADSLRLGKLKDLVKLGAARALKTLDCLSKSEFCSLEGLLLKDRVSEQDSEALSKLILATRYGIWREISDIVGGKNHQGQGRSMHTFGRTIQAGSMFDDIFGATNRAALAYETMPGCGGGAKLGEEESFLEQNPFKIKNSIFSNESYNFDKEMFCVVCQAPPKKNEKPKMCGPCGLCKACDQKIKAKETKVIAA